MVFTRIIRHPLFVFISIVLLALILRIYGINWDQNQHLHPDERFLTMVAGAMKLPQSLWEYLNPKVSLVNPSNINFPFYVYGTLPVVITKSIAVFMQRDNYNDITIIGRALSAVLDVGTLLSVYFIGRLFERFHSFKKSYTYYAIFLYSLFVFPIQQSHFFTVDSWLVFLSSWSLYFGLRYYYFGRLWDAMLCGIFLGASMGAKVSALYLLPLVICLSIVSRATLIQGATRSALIYRLFALLLMGCSFYVAMRLSAPYYFADSSLIHIKLNEAFVTSIRSLESYNRPDIGFPPAVQWISKHKILFPLQNILLYGLGPGMSFFLGFGSLAIIFKVCIDVKGRMRTFLWGKRDLLLVGGWAISYFVYQGMQFGMTMRYFYILYPLIAILTSFGLGTLLEKYKKLAILMLAIALMWPYAFMHIYTKDHSRVEAAIWSDKYIADKSVIAGEYWDDPLPFSILREGKTFEMKALPVFERDTEDKWKRMNEIINASDYYILSSNRGYGSIIPLEDRYPRMSIYYKNLLSGNTEWKLVKTVTSYPTICIPFTQLCYEIDDQQAEEAFTVYDHPQVLIYKK